MARNDKNKPMSVNPKKAHAAGGAARGSANSDANGMASSMAGDVEQAREAARAQADARAQQIYEKAQRREQQKAQRAGGGAGGVGGGVGVKEDKGPAAFVKGTIKELKLTTWPAPAELVRWCLIVIATVGLLAVGAMVVDNFVATPLLYWLSSFNIANGSFNIIDIVLLVILFLSGIGAVIGIYLHSGGDTEGLSDTVAMRISGGSGQVQKNLDRITLVCIIVFALCLLAAVVIYPSGTLTTY